MPRAARPDAAARALRDRKCPACTPANIPADRLPRRPRTRMPTPTPVCAEQKLREYFENYGTVDKALVAYELHTGPLGYAFVVFADHVTADKACWGCAPLGLLLALLGAALLRGSMNPPRPAPWRMMFLG